jgi:CCR4-NOT transcription complex subunit 1
VLIEDLKQLNSIGPLRSIAGKENNLRDQLATMFADWVRLFLHPSCSERGQLKHVNLMISQGIMQNDDVACLFFRVCTGLCSYLIR